MISLSSGGDFQLIRTNPPEHAGRMTVDDSGIDQPIEGLGKHWL
jgi:16S rRNA G1207 methylase RsmC